MSHYCEVRLKVHGDVEPILRALCEMPTLLGCSWNRTDIKVDMKNLVNLTGYQGDVRKQKAHVVIPGRRSKHGVNVVGGAANDIGLEQVADGSWAFRVSQNEERFYGKTWQKTFMSKWAIQRIGCEAEAQGHQWSVKYGEGTKKNLAYVSVIQNRSW